MFSSNIKQYKTIHNSRQVAGGSKSSKHTQKSPIWTQEKTGRRGASCREQRKWTKLDTARVTGETLAKERWTTETRRGDARKISGSRTLSNLGSLAYLYGALPHRPGGTPPHRSSRRAPLESQAEPRLAAGSTELVQPLPPRNCTISRAYTRIPGHTYLHQNPGARYETIKH